MVELKTDTSIDERYAAGQVVGRALTAVREAADVGVSLLELDEVAHQVLAEAGAGSPFLGYRPHFAPTPFPAVICASVNDAIVHGIPDGSRLCDGDQRLIEATRQALAAGIEAAVVGARIGDISHAGGAVGRAAGYGIPADFGG